MTTLTHYLFYIDSRRNTIQIKPKQGSFVEECWAQELRTALACFISANTAISDAIATSFAEGKNQVIDIKLALSWIRAELIFLRNELPQVDQLILSFTKSESEDFRASDRLYSERSREEFFAEMTHEIRTSLNIVLGNSRLINTAPSAEQGHLIENTIAASEQLLQLTNDYLDRFKSRELCTTKSREIKNLKQFVHSVSYPFRALAHSKRIDFESKIDPDLDQYAEFSPLPVAQVINNLLSNAIAHLHETKSSSRVLFCC
jgi:signal transduction histidine kinase